MAHQYRKDRCIIVMTRSIFNEKKHQVCVPNDGLRPSLLKISLKDNEKKGILAEKKPLAKRQCKCSQQKLTQSFWSTRVSGHPSHGLFWVNYLSVKTQQTKWTQWFSGEWREKSRRKGQVPFPVLQATHKTHLRMMMACAFDSLKLSC